MNKDILTKPELLAPAGDWSMLNTAINSGANAVYFGLKQLNMRAAAGNFELENLNDVVQLCTENNVKAHLTLNTIVFENELGELEKIISASKAAGIEMIICWDMSVIQKCIEYEIPFCISTQASISNSASANFYQKIGAKRLVLARECTLEKIKEINNNTTAEVEVFIHGAMCVAVSGRCFMSHDLFNKSANRGECLQPCRREYEVKDVQEKYSLVLGSDYVMSPKDLCTIEFIDKIIESGVTALKIEGRKRAPEYIAKVVSTYRRAIDLYFDKSLTPEIKSEMLEDLRKVYNRGFSPGFYFGNPDENDFSHISGSASTTKKQYVGKVVNVFKKTNIVQVRIETGSLQIGDSIYIIGSTTGVVEQKITHLQFDEKIFTIAEKGNDVTFECSSPVRQNDKIYKIV